MKKLICVLLSLAAHAALAQTNSAAGFTGFHESPQFNERVASFTFEPEVKIHINAPASPAFTKRKKVLLVFFTLPNGNSVKAELAGRDPSTDVAVLRVSASGLTMANWAEPAQLKAGHLAFAVGKPWDNTPIVSGGIISAVGVGIRGHGRNGFVQSDVVMLPGFSGGPLVDASGRIIGMNSSVLGRGVSLAIPVETMRRVVSDLLKEGRVKRPYLGVGLQHVPLAESLSKKVGGQERALMILTVENGGPAEQSGLLPGDILLSIDDTKLQSVEDLQKHLTPAHVGQAVKVKVVRGGELKEVSVKVGSK